MKFVWFVMYETLLLSIKNYFKQSKRTNAELSDKLHGIFESNNAEYEKLANWYDESTPRLDIFGMMEHEHYVIENYKKSVYGDEYEVKPFGYEN